MATVGLRRSERLGTYDANGRDFLSSTLGWSRSKFEEWLNSETVRPHLEAWYVDCISNNERYNDAVDWINSGPQGYFYNESDLEEDLRLMCLNAGYDDHHADCGDSIKIDFAAPDVDTEEWITQELWARTAWRVVKANCSTDQAFERAIHDRPAFPYSFIIETLCIMFHSIAHRGVDSVYLALLKNGQTSARGAHSHTARSLANTSSKKLDEEEYTETSRSSSEDADRSSDATFAVPTKNRPGSELSTIIIPTDPPTPIDTPYSDIGSNILVLPRRFSQSTKTSPKTVGSAGEGNVKEPLTPDSSVGLRAMVRANEDSVVKHEWIREWLAKISAGWGVGL